MKNDFVLKFAISDKGGIKFVLQCSYACKSCSCTGNPVDAAQLLLERSGLGLYCFCSGLSVTITNSSLPLNKKYLSKR